MPHFKSFFENKTLGAWSFRGETVVTIERVQRETLKNRSGSDVKPVIYFRGSKLGFPCNRTNGTIIAGLLGSSDTDDWIGKRIIVFPTTTSFGRDTVECVRVKNQLPAKGGEDGAISDEDAPPDMRARQQAAADRAAGLEPAHDPDTGVVLTEQLEASTVDAYARQIAAATTYDAIGAVVAKAKGTQFEGDVRQLANARLREIK